MVLLQKFLICRYQWFIMSDNVKLSRKVLINFSTITSSISAEKNLENNYYLIARCYFGTMNPHAFKLFVKILLAKIFETVN